MSDNLSYTLIRQILIPTVVGMAMSKKRGQRAIHSNIRNNCSLTPFSLRALMLLCLFVFSSQARATESVAVENTAPDDAVVSPTPITDALMQRPLLREATIEINFRAYRFDRETVNDRRDYANALGGEIFVETREFLDIAQIGLSYYSSNLVGDSQNPGLTGLVEPNGDDLNVLGQAYLLLGGANGWQASLYRRGTNVPYLDTEDSRMIPRTHETYFILHGDERGTLGFGHFTRTKSKTSERFIPMSEAAGAFDTDRGVSIVGAKYNVLDDATIGVFNQYGWDTFNTLYAEANWSSYFARSRGTQVGLQYTDQRSVGDELVGDFRTWHAGIKASNSVKSAMLTLAYTQVGDNASIRFPWGGFPSYNWGMLEDFNRPGERAWRLGLSLNGSAWGYHAWSGFVNFSHGYDAIIPSSGAAAPDVTEAAATIDYKPEWGRLEGLWVRFRAGRAEFNDGSDVSNVRLILNYSLPIR